jgi:hypothetical protein
MRELRENRSGSNYLDLVNTQIKIAQMCMILEDFRIEDYGIEDVEMWKIADIHDDLASLAMWLDRTLKGMRRYLDSYTMQEKIAKLRNTIGRTPEEAKTAIELAERLEQKMLISTS